VHGFPPIDRFTEMTASTRVAVRTLILDCHEERLRCAAACPDADWTVRLIQTELSRLAMLAEAEHGSVNASRSKTILNRRAARC
jgi:hypothetical protein